jgi:hypothetical protein
MVYYEIQINLDTLSYSATLSDIDTLFHLSKLIWNGKSQSLHEKRTEQYFFGAPGTENYKNSQKCTQIIKNQNKRSMANDMGLFRD